MFQKETSWCSGNKGSGKMAENEQGHSGDTNCESEQTKQGQVKRF